MAMMAITAPTTHNDVISHLLAVFIPLIMTMTMVAASPALGETYKWTDAGGNIHFSDDPAAVPKKYRGKVATSADITLADPQVRQEVEEGRRVAAILQKEDQARRNELLRREQAYESERKQTRLKVQSESQRKQVQSKVQTEKRAAAASVQVNAPVKRRVG